MVRKNEHMFGKVDLTPVSLSVLTYLARNPGKEFYVRELAGNLGYSLGGVYEALQRLLDHGLVRVRKSGRNSYYKVNEDFPALVQFKIFQNVLELGPIIEPLKTGSIKIILYGSCAAGTDTQESDIDLFILVKNPSSMKTHIPKSLLGREIKPYISSPRKLLMLKEKDPAFYKEINKGMVLWDRGDEEYEEQGF